MPAEPDTARPEEWPAVFRLLLCRVPEAQREERVARALGLIEHGELRSEGIFLVRGDDGPKAALTCLPLPGATALLFPPQGRGTEQIENEDRLVRHAFQWLRQQGVKLVQALLPVDALFGIEALERNGFLHLTHLWYLRHRLDVPVHCLDTPARLEFLLEADEPDRFAEVLFRSYDGTLDCPEINHVRTMEETLTGHRSQGVFDPRLWWLAQVDGRQVGVLIAAKTLNSAEWDVGYVGIVPEARRRGFGREVMLRLLFEARAAGVPAVTLSVDGRNHPAWNLYRDLGFEVYDRREVYLAIWQQS